MPKIAKMLTGVEDVVHVALSFQIGFLQITLFFIRFAILFLELKIVGTYEKKFPFKRQLTV